MKKAILSLVVLISIALPILAASVNGCIDWDGSKAADKAALLASWEAPAAPVADVVIGEVTVDAPAVTVLEEVNVVGQVRTASVAKSAPIVCRMEGLKTDVGGQVKFCSTQSFREAVDRSEGSI